MSCCGEGKALEQLRWHYNHRHAAALDAHRAGMAVVGVTSNTVPFELIAASGMFPLLLSPDENYGEPSSVDTDHSSGPSPHEIFMEDVFDARTRAIFDFLVSGKGAFLSSVIVPRTSEREHKLFLYLKEVQRQQNPNGLPNIYLFNLLHTRSEEARAYSFDRTQELAYFLESQATTKGTVETSLRDAIRAGNEARAVARSLVQIREAKDGTLSGRDAIALLGARYFMDSTKYTRLALAAIREIEQCEKLLGPRIIIKGYPLEHDGLHREVEANGAIVSAEDDAWGSRSATPDIATDGNPLHAIFEHYYSFVPSSRVFPLNSADDWFRDKARRADGVLFYLPPDDDVIGWDYPGHCAYLDKLGLPYLLVRADAATLADKTNRNPVANETARQIRQFIAQLISTRGN